MQNWSKWNEFMIKTIINICQWSQKNNLIKSENKNVEICTILDIWLSAVTKLLSELILFKTLHSGLAFSRKQDNEQFCSLCEDHVICHITSFVFVFCFIFVLFFARNSTVKHAYVKNKWNYDRNFANDLDYNFASNILCSSLTNWAWK